MIDNLPQRIDPIYKEIENFEDYEYTNCIAYEMAIRNQNVKKLLREIIDYPLFEYSPYEDQHLELDKKLEREYFIDYKIRKHLKFSYESYLKEYHEVFFKRLEYVKVMQIFEKKVFEKDISEELINYEEKAIDFFYSNIEKIKFVYDKFTTEENRVHNNSKPLMKKFYGVTQGGKFIEEEDEKKAIIENRKFLAFSRPRLLISKDIDKTINLNINLKLPLEELQAYIKQIKIQYDKDNSIIKNPLELLGEVMKKSNSKISKKLIADKFFVYDYVKARQREILESEDYYKIEYEEQKVYIQNDNSSTPKEKKIQLNQLEKEYKENSSSRIKEVFIEFKNMKNFKKSAKTAERYYYEIRPFIEDLKYKELITGIQS